VAAAATLAAAASGPPAAVAEGVEGSWQQLVNCAFTHYDPATHAMGCDGSTLWRGTWTGVTHYRVAGTYDLLTGDSSGTFHETFYGHDARGRRGTLSFNDRYTITGATSTIHIVGAITGGTGGFVGARGTVRFDGTDNVLTGSGRYSGDWTSGG
jgi:hypothetical protein